MEELSTLRELKLRLEEPQAREGPELPHWALRDERFRCLLREAQRQVSLQQVPPPPTDVRLSLQELTSSSYRLAKASRSNGRRRQQRGG